MIYKYCEGTVKKSSNKSWLKNHKILRVLNLFEP